MGSFVISKPAGSGSHIETEGMGNSESPTKIFSALYLETKVRGRTFNNG